MGTPPDHLRFKSDFYRGYMSGKDARRRLASQTFALGLFFGATWTGMIAGAFWFLG